MKKWAALSQSRTEGKRVEALEDRGASASATPELTPEAFARTIARQGLRSVGRKKLLTLRVDSDVLEWYKKQGPGYQTRINALLRAYMQERNKAHPAPRG